jgi:SAM-dependent methyltransferase
MRILEVGSREVTGKSEMRERFSQAEYVGFDFYGGNNVDVVGDAHKLSTYFAKEEKFDIIYSSACFEHFAMPWVVAMEISKLLKVGGIVFIETHFSFNSHERPWHFFQYSDMGLKVLFSPAMGFECLDAGMSNPIAGRFSSLSDKYLRNNMIRGLFCHSEFLGKKVKDVENFEWINVNLDEVVGETKYPAPKTDILTK